MRIGVIEAAPFGGLLHYGFQFADGLARRDNEVDLLVTRENELAERPSAARVRAVLQPTVRIDTPPPTGGLPGIRRRAGVGIRLARCWSRAVTEIIRGRFDVVLITTDIGPWPATVSAAALTLIPRGPAVCCVMHNAREPNRWEGSNLVADRRRTRSLRDFVLNRCALVLVHGETARREVSEAHPGATLAVIPHGDESMFAAEAPPASREERILFFGNWNRVKGIDVLTEAFDLLIERRPGAKLTLAGMPNPLELDLEAIRLWASGHDDRVELIERYIPVEEVPEIFARARLVVTPYVLGSQSGVIHLAMTMGRAVVTSDVGDLGAAVVDGTTGLVVPPGDPEALANAMERVLEDPELAGRMGDAGRRRVLDASSWDRVAEGFEQALASRSGAQSPGRG